MHPFIRKARGPNLLSELVAESMDNIERFRRQEFKEDTMNTCQPMDTMVLAGEADSQKGGTMINYNTVIQNSDSDDEECKTDTMIVKYDSTGSSQEYKNTIEHSGSRRIDHKPAQEEEPFFMKYFKEVDGDKSKQAAAATPKKVEDHPDIPPQYRGMSIEFMEKMLKRLDVDEEAEIEAVRARYTTRRVDIQKALHAMKECSQ